MELGRSAWIRRERLERIATAERDRRAGRTALAIAALGEAVEWPARAVLALALLPEAEGAHTRRILEEGLDQWAQESGLPALDESIVGSGAAAASIPATVASVEPAMAALAIGPSERVTRGGFQIELDRPIEPGELERAFAEAEAQVEEMHDVNEVAAGVLFDGAFDALDVGEDDLDPLERSARASMAETGSRSMDAACVPERPSDASAAMSGKEIGGRRGASRAFVLATLERWLENLERARSERIR
ncbi:MAG: hypothetical protein R3F35_02895 [Myxococcota bacterium]